MRKMPLEHSRCAAYSTPSGTGNHNFDLYLQSTLLTCLRLGLRSLGCFWGKFCFSLCVKIMLQDFHYFGTMIVWLRRLGTYKYSKFSDTPLHRRKINVPIVQWRFWRDSVDPAKTGGIKWYNASPPRPASHIRKFSKGSMWGENHEKGNARCRK